MKKTGVLLLALCFLLCALVPFSLAEGTDTAAPIMTEEHTAITQAVTAFLGDTMTAMADASDNAWQTFVYAQGIDAPSMNLEKFDIDAGKALSVKFKLCSGKPDVKSLEKYDGSDPAAYLDAFAATCKAHDTASSVDVLVTKEGDAYSVAFAKGGEAALEKAVKAAATKGKEAFKESSTLLRVVSDYLTPSPVATTSKKAPTALTPYQPAFEQFLARNPAFETSGLAAPAFYSVKGQKLDVSNGPEALTLTFSMADFSRIVDDVYMNLYTGYCYDENAKSYTQDDLGEQIETRLGAEAIRYRSGKLKEKECTLTFNLFDMPTALGYDAYLSEDDALQMSILKLATIYSLQGDIAELPDYPAQDFPEKGVVEGESRGTKVTVRNRDTDAALSLTFTKADGAVALVVFLPPDSRTSFRLPKGTYTLETQYGFVWYGPEHRFGDITGTNTQEVKIYSNDYEHTLTYGG